MLDPAPALTQTQSTQPATAAALLRQLGISHISVLHQRAALAEWLQRNTATAELKLSLRANGYGLLLPRPVRRVYPRLQVAKGISTAAPRAS
jgi:hypothetical protein